MKRTTFPILLLLILGFVFPTYAEESEKPIPAEDLPWFFNLRVQKDSEYFSFTLMKEGWVSFKVWGEGKVAKDEKLEFSPDVFERLKKLFGRRFEEIQNTKEKNTGDKPSYVFERATDTLTTLSLSGEHQLVNALCRIISRTSQKPLPFDLTGE